MAILALLALVILAALLLGMKAVADATTVKAAAGVVLISLAVSASIALLFGAPL